MPHPPRFAPYVFLLLLRVSLGLPVHVRMCMCDKIGLDRRG